MKRPKEVLKEWVTAMNRRDATAAAALYDDDAINIQMASGEPVLGREAIRDGYKAFFHAFPDSYTNMDHIFEDGDWAIIEWTSGGTFRGEFGGHRPNGRNFKLHGCGFFQVAGGRIRFQRAYWDRPTWFRQIGLPLE